MTTVTATLYDRASAERAIEDLKKAGIDEKNISVVLSDDPQKVAEGAAIGAATGVGLGAVLGGLWLFGVAVAAGGAATPLLVAGPVFGALTGGMMGGALGTLVGALIGGGISETEAHAIEQDVRRGGIVVIAQVPDDQAATAQNVLRRDGGGVEPGTPKPSTIETVRGESSASSSRVTESAAERRER